MTSLMVHTVYIYSLFHSSLWNCFPAFWSRLLLSIKTDVLYKKCLIISPIWNFLPNTFFRKFNEIFFRFQRCTAFRQFYWDKENLNMSSHLTLYIGLCLNLGLGFTHFTCLCDRSRTITICALHCVPKLMFVQNIYMLICRKAYSQNVWKLVKRIPD